MIIFTHHTGEPHGILGAQLAATFFQQKLSIPSIVIGIERNFLKERLFHFIDEYYSEKERLIAFTHLCGRKDLIELIREVREQGYKTLLGGPQTRQDYEGEPEADRYSYRFKGLRSSVDLAFQGPVDGFRSDHLKIQNRLFEFPWIKERYLEVDWGNLYTFSDTLKKHDVQVAQVLHSIGCPYSGRTQTVVLPPPVDLKERVPELSVQSQGCIFCDVSKDKGFHGLVEKDRVIAQIKRLPESDGKKIPFELIDEYPLGSLGRLIETVGDHRIRLSQINLVCRVDDINRHASELSEIVLKAKSLDVKIMFASIGFESFSDRLLRYFCKGIRFEEVVKCVEILRRLKEQFGDYLLYRRDEGANHGFIRPTPWDDGETMQEVDRNIFLYRFFEDILPEHSTPLIIHHASYLGDWIRAIESKIGILFGREGTWIEWWNPSSKRRG